MIGRGKSEIKNFKRGWLIYFFYGIRVSCSVCEAQRPCVLHVSICVIHALSLKVSLHVRGRVYSINPTSEKGGTSHVFISN